MGSCHGNYLKLKGIVEFSEAIAKALGRSVYMTCSKYLTYCPFIRSTDDEHTAHNQSIQPDRNTRG
jgi:hypothetical protein